MATVLMCSVVYFLWTHSVLSRDDANQHSTAGDPRHTHIDSRSKVDGDLDATIEAPLHPYGSETQYEEDPRQQMPPSMEGGLRGAETEETRDEPALATDVELMCPGGKKPEVDLSYWKDIPADK